MIHKLVKLLKQPKQYFIIRKFNKNGNLVNFSCSVSSTTKLEGKNKIGKSNIKNSCIGYGTIIGECSLPNCLIGRFCSIANNVSVVSATHPLNFVSTYPGFYNSINNCFPYNNSIEFNEYLKTENGLFCEIGNDVWIGQNALIKGGIKIGDGAVIAMGAVVTHDVPPYSIVAGVPAKIIKYRFDNYAIQCLLKIKWWNWDLDIIEKNKHFFHNIDFFLNKFNSEN